MPGTDPLPIPSGYTQRPLVVADAGAVARLMQVQELHDVGEARIGEDDIAGDWSRPSFDLAGSTAGVFHEGALVAYGELSTAERTDAAVHPEHRGRGIGTAIARWLQGRARAAGASVVGMQVPQGSPGDALLASLGYSVGWTSWDLELAADAPLPAVGLPEGYRVRLAERGERAACFAVIETAFGEWSAPSMTLPDWEARFLDHPGAPPWGLRAAIDPDGAVVGAAVTVLFDGAGYVEQLATRADRRGLGLGVALLADAFGAARAHGATSLRLSADTRSGALGLYERVGMRVSSTWVRRELRLGEPPADGPPSDA